MRVCVYACLRVCVRVHACVCVCVLMLCTLYSARCTFVGLRVLAIIFNIWINISIWAEGAM